MEEDISSQISFSTQLKYGVATFLFFTVAYIMSLAYQHIGATGRLNTSRFSGHSILTLPFHLCAFVLALSGLWILLFVSAAAFSASVLKVNYIFFWVEYQFLRASWTGLSWASTVAFFVVFPFAFLYEEAEGLTSQSGFLSRVLETLTIQSLIAISFHGSLAILQFMVTGQPFEAGFLMSGYAFQIPGLLAYLVYFRHGFPRLLRDAYCLFVPWPVPLDSDVLASYEFELEAILQQIEAANRSQKPYIDDYTTRNVLCAGVAEDVLIEDLEKRLHELQTLHSDAVRHRWRCQTVVQNIVACLMSFISILFPIGIAIRAAARCEDFISMIIYRIFNVEIDGMFRKMWRPQISSVVLFISDMSLVMYLFVAVSTAALDSWIFKWAAGLTNHSRSKTQEVLARNTFLLLLCSTLPAVSSLLGLAHVDLGTGFPEPQQYSCLVYCAAFFLLEAIAVCEMIGVPIKRSVLLVIRIAWFLCCCCLRCKRQAGSPKKIKRK
uniref:Uncharacterized protein n=1 Tax=Spongospora subterranea TaxID=70186 RepID=A0A0H5R979_9EUKA|eukprot:CRZ10683.1 hypothetical protein [Spongospora subterranea]